MEKSKTLRELQEEWGKEDIVRKKKWRRRARLFKVLGNLNTWIFIIVALFVSNALFKGFWPQLALMMLLTVLYALGCFFNAMEAVAEGCE